MVAQRVDILSLNLPYTKCPTGYWISCWAIENSNELRGRTPGYINKYTAPEFRQYNVSMVHYRKLLRVSLIALATIVMALYSHHLVDSNSIQIQPDYAVSESWQADKIQLGIQIIAPDDVHQEVQPSTEIFITEDSQDITPVIENITLSGWVGTEFGQIFAGETVVLYSPNLGARYSAVANSSGEFIFTDLKPSYDYTLKVFPRGMFKRYVKFPIKFKTDREVHNIVLEPIPLGILTGRITDLYGRPVTSIELSIKTLEIDSWSTNVITDANGSFSVGAFPKGRYQLAIKEQQSLRASGLKFDPDAGESINLTIDLGPYSLRGHIYDESGRTFDGASVFLKWALQQNGVRIRSTRQLNVDASGEFLFSGLGPGDHELVVSAWRDDTFGQTTKQTIRQTVNMGVDPEEIVIYLNTL